MARFDVLPLRWCGREPRHVRPFIWQLESPPYRTPFILVARPEQSARLTMSDLPPTVNLDPPDEVVWIAKRLEAAGFDTWAVGGGVRDALIGLKPQDWDLTTSARPAQIQRLFRRTVPIGLAYGTVGVLARNGRMYEVTTFRRDVETFGRKARVHFADRLEEDLDRRDFTINAVAWHPITREVRDPHGGMPDLQNGILRSVGEPAHRFEEDRLRVLRALRFAGRFSLRIEEATWAALVASADKLQALSAERVRDELMKVLSAAKPATALELYATSGVLRHLYPELEQCLSCPDHEKNGFQAALEACNAVSRRKPVVRLAALFHAVGWCENKIYRETTETDASKSAALVRTVLGRLRASNDERDAVTHLIAQSRSIPEQTASDVDIRRWIRRVGPEFTDDLFRLILAVETAWNAPPSRKRELREIFRRVVSAKRSAVPFATTGLAIDGRDLQRLGIPPGPLMGEVLRDLLEMVTDDPSLNEHGRLMDLVQRRLS